MNSFGTRCSIIIEKLRGLPEYEEILISLFTRIRRRQRAQKSATLSDAALKNLLTSISIFIFPPAREQRHI
jgi:hypothetical protein